MSREEDINKLCKIILEDVTLEFWDNPNGPYEHTCPLCKQMETSDWPSMNTFNHDSSCAYLIAKDLMTNIK